MINIATVLRVERRQRDKKTAKQRTPTAPTQMTTAVRASEAPAPTQITKFRLRASPGPDDAVAPNRTETRAARPWRRPPANSSSALESAARPTTWRGSSPSYYKLSTSFCSNTKRSSINTQGSHREKADSPIRKERRSGRTRPSASTCPCFQNTSAHQQRHGHRPTNSSNRGRWGSVLLSHALVSGPEARPRAQLWFILLMRNSGVAGAL